MDQFKRSRKFLKPQVYRDTVATFQKKDDNEIASESSKSIGKKYKLNVLEERLEKELSDVNVLPQAKRHK